MSRFSLLLDTADQFWQDWVMGYNLERQVVLASRMGESSRSLQLPRLDEIGDWFDGFFKSGWLMGISLRWFAAGVAILAVAIAVWICSGRRSNAGCRRTLASVAPGAGKGIHLMRPCSTSACSPNFPSAEFASPPM